MLNKNLVFMLSVFAIILAVIASYKNVRSEMEFEEIASLLVVYDAKVDDKPLEFCRWGSENDGGYVLPKILFEKSDVLVSYGIADNITFESDFSKKYDKESFCFDGGVTDIDTGSPKCHFFSECIGSDKYLWQTSSGKVASYSEHIKRFNLENKKVLLKMDIEGAEFDVFPDILQHSENITGIILEVHFAEADQVLKAYRLLSAINRNFLLVHVHGNNYCPEIFKVSNTRSGVSKVLELTYVNRNLLDEYRISANQKHPTALDRPSYPYYPDYEFEILVH